MDMWLKNPNTGKKDTMLTAAIASVSIVLIKFFFSGIQFGSVNFGQLDAGVVAALLTPTFGAYAIRKNSEEQLNAMKEKEDAKKD